jgi:pimeloyl-ACP methyl ester carboxylesterase
MGVRPVSGWCETNGCRIAWHEISAGHPRGQVILCLHSEGAGGREFRPLMNRYPAGCRFIVLDWPGHGRSEVLTGDSADKFTVDTCAAILDALLGRLEIERPILLSCGFGAAVAIRYAADHPDNVLGVVLCLPAGLVPVRSAEPFSQRGKRGIHRLLKRIKRYAPSGSANAVEVSALRQALRMEALDSEMQSMRAAGRQSSNSAAPGLRQALDSLSCPVLFALSRDSHEYPLRKYLAFLDPSLAWAPQHRFTVFSGAFHPIWDEPERFAVALTSFIQAQLPVENHTHAWILYATDWPTDKSNLWKCIHPDCAEESVLPVGQDANQKAGPGNR